MANLTVVHNEWVNLDKPGGQVFFVGGGTVAYKGKGASDNNSGLSPQQALSTISGAITKCVASRGDTIALLPGNVSVTTALAMSKADVTLTGVDGNGIINPSAITVGAAIDGINVTAANVTIENIHFRASPVTGTTSRIDAGAAGLVVRGCTFDCGAYDLVTITIPAAGLHTTVRECRFYVTADGPDAAIRIENAAAHYVVIENNNFNGMNDSNGWDSGAIWSSVAHLSCLVRDNVNSFGKAITFSAAATGMISDNDMGEGALGAMLDPGSCMCTRNWEADAIDQKAREFPTTAAS
jgi:hypothetical protein